MPVLPDNCKMDSNRGGFEMVYVGTPEQLEAVPSGMYTPAEGSVLTIVTDLTAAQVDALAATPQTIVPAPGAGKALQLIDLVLVLNYGGTPYSAGVLQAKMTDDSGVALSTSITFAEFLDKEEDIILNVQSIVTNVALTANKPIVLDATTDAAGGNSPIKVIATARVIETGL